MKSVRRKVDPVSLELARHLFGSVVEAMGQVLMRSAFSPNIKERRDYSCALFDSQGRAVALGDHMPVHLGSMPATVARVLESLPPRGGEMVAINDPFAGGTHLPDITLVAPYPRWSDRPRFYLANRAHHSDVGGAYPGSMAPGAQEIYQEGIVLPPVRLVRGGKPDPDLLRLFLANVRTPGEREADLRAQIAANLAGAHRLEEMDHRIGKSKLSIWASAQVDYALRIVRTYLREIPDGRYVAEEFLEGDGLTEDSIRLRVSIRVRKGRVTVDFTGTDPMSRGNINAVESITRSAVYFAFRCLVQEEIPYNDGCFRPLDIRIPCGTILSARRPAAVAGGNVETSQRVVDVVLAALREALPDRIPAQSCGTMTNVTLGGRDPRSGAAFTYYETVGGGMGASAFGPGLSGVHTAMTNSQNTPVEALEQAYPLRVTRYALRRGSGGKGRHAGGEGILREIGVLSETEAALLTDRHLRPPQGTRGGGPGKTGQAWKIVGRSVRRLGSKVRFSLSPGQSVRIATPGGGGWGKPRRTVP